MRFEKGVALIEQVLIKQRREDRFFDKIIEATIAFAMDKKRRAFARRFWSKWRHPTRTRKEKCDKALCIRVFQR